MTPSQFAATNILPLLARLVLCFAFLPQGWNNLMRDVEFTAYDAQRLRELGVRGITDPDPRRADIALGAMRGWDPPAEAAPKEGSAPTDAPAAAPTAAPAAVPAPGVPAPAPAAAPTASPAPAPVATTAPLTQRGLYTLALVADRARLPFPTETAWAVAGVQLVGGACILLGLFSRVWGLLFGVILAGLFVTTSLPVLRASGPFALSVQAQNLVLAQLGLFVLTLGIFLVGPGALSLDRAIFRTRRRAAAKGAARSA